MIQDIDYIHQSIMVKEILDLLSIKPTDIVVDCTAGEGGHSEQFLKQLDTGKLIVLDRDEEILNITKKRLTDSKIEVIFKNANFSAISDVLTEVQVQQADVLFYDLGISMYHFKRAERGFSFMDETSLDMRLNLNEGLSAYDIVNSYRETEIADIIYRYGEEQRSRRVARAIVAARKQQKIQTSAELRKIVEAALPKRRPEDKIHPVTKTFQGLRIYVNDELNHLKLGIMNGIRKLKVGGRIGFLTFHSLEDRIVKQVFRLLSQSCVCPMDYPVCQCDGQRTLKILTKKPISPIKEEIERNPAARSAKLRVAEKIYEVSDKTWDISKSPAQS